MQQRLWKWYDATIYITQRNPNTCSLIHIPSTPLQCLPNTSLLPPSSRLSYASSSHNNEFLVSLLPISLAHHAWRANTWPSSPSHLISPLLPKMQKTNISKSTYPVEQNKLTKSIRGLSSLEESFTCPPWFRDNRYCPVRLLTCGQHCLVSTWTWSAVRELQLQVIEAFEDASHISGFKEWIWKWNLAIRHDPKWLRCSLVVCTRVHLAWKHQGFRHVSRGVDWDT